MLLDQAKNEGGLSSAQLVAHEVLEGYYESKGQSFMDAHTKTNQFFGGLIAGAYTSITVQNGILAIGVHRDYTVVGSGAVEDFTIRYTTPIPLTSLLNQTTASPSGYVVDVEKRP